MEVDYIIIGAGIAGCTLAMELDQRGSSVWLIDQPSATSASGIAAGLVNPIVPKRVIPTWNAQTIFSGLPGYYKHLESKLGNAFFKSFPMLQIHASEQEHRMWQQQTAKVENETFLKAGEASESLPINAPFGHTWILQCGRLHVQEFCTTVKSYFEQKHQFSSVKISHENIKITSQNGANFYSFNGIISHKIIFCEGPEIQSNPYFKNIPVRAYFGDILRIKTKVDFPSNIILKQKHWVVPDGENQFLAGSNFIYTDWDESSMQKDVEAIVSGLKKWFVPFELLESKRAARPVLFDRRPVIGAHPDYSGMFVFNGLGTKGCSLCSWLAPILAEHLVSGSPLPEETDIRRFYV